MPLSEALAEFRRHRREIDRSMHTISYLTGPRDFSVIGAGGGSYGVSIAEPGDGSAVALVEVHAWGVDAEEEDV